MKPKGKYVCRECDEFSIDEKARLDGHYLGAHRIFKIKCKQCDYSHQHPGVLKNHVQSVHEKIRQKCNLCELTYATKSGVRRHVKNVHGPTLTSEFDTNSSTDENDGDSDDTDNDENSTDEDSDIDEATDTSSDEGDQMETGTPVPNAGDIETTKWIHDDPAWD